METQDITPATTPQPEGLRGRVKKPVNREVYYIDWSQYPSIWHLPNKWIAEALGYSRSGVALARHRDAPAPFREEPTDPKVWLQVAYPLVEGRRWAEDDILDLLIKLEELENRLTDSARRIDQLKDSLACAGVDVPEPSKPESKTWSPLRVILGGGLAVASLGILISMLTGGAK